MTMTRLTEAQERVLLRKHATGDFGKHTWSTIRALFVYGMLTETDDRRVIVTERGLEYLRRWHAYIRS